MSQPKAEAVQAAIRSFKEGSPVLVHDATDREGETDLLFPALTVRYPDVRQLRADAGGLVCVAVADRVAAGFDLPFRQEALDHPATEAHDLAYDERSSFSLTVNHRDTRTGITDRDRALTIRSLGTAAADPAQFPFVETFRSPGHVHILRAAAGGTGERTGHTELAVALAQIAELPEAVALAEMLDDETGKALPPRKARSYGQRNGIPYLEGRAIQDRLGNHEKPDQTG